MASQILIHPPYPLPHSAALTLSQQAPRVLKPASTFSLPYPLSLLTSTETPETWTAYENLLLACLRTGDDGAARECLRRLTDRFGAGNERVMALRGMADEAAAGADGKALEKVLRGYEAALKEDGANMPIQKRRVALLRSMGREEEAISALVKLLDVSPTDAESWAELADLYLAQNMYSQAIFSLEEVLLIMPNAWNIHARMGEMLYMSAMATSGGNDGTMMKGVAESMRRFCRSIELCDNYLRGYYGLKLTTKRLLELRQKVPKQSSAASDPLYGDLAPPSVETVQRLHELATSKLAEIVRRKASGEKGWEGYDEAEIKAAKELLEQETEPVAR